MHCLGCGYNLKQLTAPRCPECGRGFEARDERTWGSAKAFRYRRTARVAGWLLFLAAVVPSVLGFARIALGEDPVVIILIWMIAFVPVVGLAFFWAGCLIAGDCPPRFRAGMAIVLILILNASYLTHWPADVGFQLSRSELTRAAQQAQAGTGTIGPLPARVGIYRVHTLGHTFTGNQPGPVVMGLSPNSNGPDYLVYGMTDDEIEARFWLWSYHRLDKDWHIVHED